MPNKTFSFHTILIAIVCIPVLFINLKSGHDWGDDFAGYIMQAKNIAEHKPEKVSGYIVNPSFPGYAPQSYPSGFPLLLAVVYHFSGLNIVHFNLFIGVFLYAFLILKFIFLRRKMPPLYAAILVCIVAYNPWTLNFKCDITSDIPFAFFLLAAVMLYSKKSSSAIHILLLILVTGFLISVRTIGIAFVLAVIADGIISIFKNRKSKNKIESAISGLKFILIAIGSVSVYLIIEKIIFPSGEILQYSYLIDFKQLKHFLLANSEYYLAVMRSFFEPWNGQWQFIAILTGSFSLTFIILGMIKKFSSSFQFIDMFVVIYCAVILVYPYSNSGFRFLFPLIPFLLKYALMGISSVNISLKISSTKLSLLIALIVFASYQQGWREIYKMREVNPEGPFETENKSALDFIAENTPAEATFSFSKPRALSLFANRKALTHHPQESQEQIASDLKEFHVDYILVNPEVTHQNINEYIRTHEQNVEKIFQNSKNTVYKIK